LLTFFTEKTEAQLQTGKKSPQREEKKRRREGTEEVKKKKRKLAGNRGKRKQGSAGKKTTKILWGKACETAKKRQTRTWNEVFGDGVRKGVAWENKKKKELKKTKRWVERSKKYWGGSHTCDRRTMRIKGGGRGTRRGREMSSTKESEVWQGIWYLAKKEDNKVPEHLGETKRDSLYKRRGGGIKAGEKNGVRAMTKKKRADKRRGNPKRMVRLRRGNLCLLTRGNSRRGGSWKRKWWFNNAR